ncbi:MAG: hypothetical protein JSU01_23690 [Bacteroidetes bacterium]|nr:hypothetical protein [Bacteroidota bacterium]
MNYSTIWTLRALLLTSSVICLLPDFLYSQTIKEKQKIVFNEKLTPARGHYKLLQHISPAPKSPAEKIDSVRYVSDPVSVKKRLSLKPFYLQNVSASELKIPSPPANSSLQTRAELGYMFDLEKNRTEEDIRESHFLSDVYYNLNIHKGDSLYDANRANLFYIGHSIGNWFNAKSLPLTADMMANAWQDANYFIWSLKYKYARIRPYILEPKLHNLEKADAPSYPTGTATDAYLMAYIYQELAPEFTDIFIADAYKMSLSREIVGVHFPSDVEGSRILARQIVNKLFQNPRFRQDFEKAKAEWALKEKEKLAQLAE